jgi:hypothetical protein
MTIENKTSLKIPYQLPEFIRSDTNYQTFVAFLQAYYEWMEQQNIAADKQGVIYGTQKLLNYSDIDYYDNTVDTKKYTVSNSNTVIVYAPYHEVALNDNIYSYGANTLLANLNNTGTNTWTVSNVTTDTFTFNTTNPIPNGVYTTGTGFIIKTGQEYTYNKFIDYYLNDFLPNFPQDCFADKTKLIKVARELYSKKGTPASYEFLFRALYNSDADVFLSRDVVLRASDGKWYVSKSLKLDTEDEQFLSIQNLRLFGESSKSIATVERGVRTGTRIELYISNIERLFESGETVRVVDNNNQTLYFKDSEIVSANTTGSTSLRAKIIGSISSVQVNSNKRGQLYRPRDIANGYSGDPVVFYGGLNPESVNPIGAEAYVLETTSGSIRAVNVNEGGIGYREDPNTLITFIGGGGSGAIANVGAVDPAEAINVAYIPTDYISSAAQNKRLDGVYTFFGANVNANLNCSLANAFTFVGFSTYPISSVIVNNGGGGYIGVPSVKAESLYNTTDPETTESLRLKGKLGSLGILGPIEIVTPGTGYVGGEYITFSNTAGGVGANANITVNATGSITSVSYRYANTSNKVVVTPLGGIGYKADSLPTLNVATATGSGAVLRVNNVLGVGAQLEAVPDERGIGAITSILVTNFGEDYISAPRVSLKVRDLIVTNVSPTNIPTSNDIIYQGTSIDSFVFKANIDSISLVSGDVDPLQSKYRLRVYNYTSNTKTDLQLKITNRNVGANLYLDLDTTYNTFDSSLNPLFKDGIRTYGNGAAQATARFLNGLIIGAGQYLNDDGFPSSFQVLQSEDYNNFTYQLKVQESFSAYKEILYALLHPAGTRVKPIYTLKSDAKINVVQNNYKSNSLPLSYYTGTTGSNATVFASFSNPSNNIIKFDALVGANIAEFINVNSYISVTNTHGPNLFSTVVSVNHTSNTVVVSDNIFLRFANVAIANVIVTNNRINITSITNQYDLINNGEYSNVENKLADIAFVGDSIRLYSNASYDYTGTVTYVSYANNTLFVTPAPSFGNSNALLSIGRNLVSTTVNIYNTVGTPGTPFLTTQSGEVLLTQSGDVLTLGI